MNLLFQSRKATESWIQNWWNMCTWSIIIVHYALPRSAPRPSLSDQIQLSTYGTKNIARADGFLNISALSPYCCAVVPGVQAQAFTETAGLATKCHKNFLIPLNSKP